MAELQATAGLYSHELDITGVKVNGEDADFELLSHEQQDSTTGKLSALCTIPCFSMRCAAYHFYTALSLCQAPSALGSHTLACRTSKHRLC